MRCDYCYAAVGNGGSYSIWWQAGRPKGYHNQAVRARARLFLREVAAGPDNHDAERVVQVAASALPGITHAPGITS